MPLEQTIQDLATITNLANMQLSAAKNCQKNKVEVFIGRDADGEGAPAEETAVEFTPNENMEKLILVGGTIKNYEIVTNSKDVYFVMVTFENCDKLPAKSRMLGCKTSC